MPNPNTPAFIGISALREVAKQVFKSVVMGPAYTDPEEMDRLQIDVISGIQYKRIEHIFLRKGGTTRRKDTHPKLNSEIGALKEREFTAKLAWDHFTDNKDRYTETVFGTDAQGAYPFSTESTEAILRSYAENLANCLWDGDIDLDVEGASASNAAKGLYDGYHTCVKHDIEDGIISKANGNLVECGAIEAPTDENDDTAYANFVDWYRGWDPRLRKQKTLVYLTSEKAMYIADAYNNRHHGNTAIKYTIGGNIIFPEMPKVTLCPVEDMGGEGTERMYATLPKNFRYFVDTENNDTFVGVKEMTDNDMRDVQFQIQSIQGAGIANPYSWAFCTNGGSIVALDKARVGDYSSTKLVVSYTESQGKIKVNGEDYTEPVDFFENDVVTLVAEAKEGFKFSNWSNGSKSETIQVVASGPNIGLIAFFEPNA